ncbi:MAG: hypothetical protein AAB495_01435 [Patescibacteria group bacterium]
MNPETKQCQNCKSSFVMEPEDIAFYEKIKVPAPTFCPECRMQRRLIFRNLRTYYRRPVEGSDQEGFSSFSPDSPFKVFDSKYWYSDKWEIDSAREYDFSRPFFEQLKELMLIMPWIANYNQKSVNSEYCANSFDLKDCYLCFNSGYSEECYYTTDTLHSKSCFDALRAEGCELSYELFDCEKCYNTFFSSHCKESSDIWFSKNLIGCHDCFGCVNLRHKSYYIFNKPYSKKEYLEKIKELTTGSFSDLQKVQAQFKDHALNFPVRYYHGLHNNNVIGDYVDHSQGCRKVFSCQDLEYCHYCQLILFMKSKDSMDMSIAGGELCYEVEEFGGYNSKFCWFGGTSDLGVGATEIQYSMNCFDCSSLFGCVGLKNKKHCILNKQYSKEGYEALVPKLIKHMNAMPYIDSKGRVYQYGEFFPAELSPFAYNETLAHEYLPLERQESLDAGFGWKEPSEKNYNITMRSADIPDKIQEVSDTISKDIIGCAHEGKCNQQCSTAYRILPQELIFYRQRNIPLPRLCPNCRHYERLKQRNPVKFYSRECQCKGSEVGKYVNVAKHFHNTEKCPNTFLTTYSPEKPDFIYCEQCYQAESA